MMHDERLVQKIRVYTKEAEGKSEGRTASILRGKSEEAHWGEDPGRCEGDAAHPETLPLWLPTKNFPWGTRQQRYK